MERKAMDSDGMAVVLNPRFGKMGAKMGKTDLTSVAYDYLSSAILSFKYQPGQVIVEQAVSQQLGISRTPVREAIKKLEAEGLVRHIASLGTFVKDISIQDIEEIYQMRELLEGAALKTAIAEASDQELFAVEAALRGLEETDVKERGRQEQYFYADKLLHDTLMKFSRNLRMISVYQNLEMQIQWLRGISSLSPQRLVKSRQEHLAILQALSSRDLDAALQALTVHLSNAKENVIHIRSNLRFGAARMDLF